MSRYGQSVVEAVASGVTRVKKGNEVLGALSGLSNFSPPTPCPKVFGLVNSAQRRNANK